MIKKLIVYYNETGWVKACEEWGRDKEFFEAICETAHSWYSVDLTDEELKPKYED